MITTSTKRRIRRVGMLITFLALTSTVFQMYLKTESKAPAPSSLESDNVFDNSRGINKVRINLRSKNLAATKIELTEVLKVIPHAEIYAREDAGSGIYIHHISGKDLDLLTETLAKTATIQSRTVMADTSLINFDEEAIQANLASKETQFNHLKQLTIRSDVQNRTMNQVYHEILDLRQKLENYKNKDQVMLYTIVSSFAPTISPLRTVVSFVLNFLRNLGFLFIATVLIYYGAKFLMYLLNLMGVKDLGVLTGYGYGQYSGYKNYSGRYSGYGYGGNKRKVKRIYKDKSSSDKSSGSDGVGQTP